MRPYLTAESISRKPTPIVLEIGATDSPSGLAPPTVVDVELHLALGPHRDEEFLERFGAFAARINPKLDGRQCSRFVESRQYLLFVNHEASALFPS